MALMKYSMRLMIMLRDVRRKIAKRRVVNFYNDFSKQKLAYVMVKFRFNCIKLQRRIRSYNMVTNARLLLLDMKWDLIEASVRDRVEKSLYTGSETGKNANKWQQKLHLNEFPELSEDINHATASVMKLKKTIQSGINLQRGTLPGIIKKLDKREKKLNEVGGADVVVGEELNVDNIK